MTCEGTTYHIDFNFLNLKPQNDGPDQTEDETGVAIDDVLSTNGLQTDLRRKKPSCIISILHSTLSLLHFFQFPFGEWSG